MKPNITAREHYDRLAEMGNGLDDPPFMQEYMARWDGPPFWDALGDLRGKDVLEAGIGIGRIARGILNQGCRSLTGLDVSPKTIELAGEQLGEFSNLELVLKDIAGFRRPESFDAVCSVLTFMHVEDKRKVLENMVDCLRPGGRIVLSIDNASHTLDAGKWTVTLHPWEPERYAEVLSSAGCEEVELTPLMDTWSGPEGERMETYGERIATVIHARRKNTVFAAER